ncbi:NAD(P)/FAD-dependent oxidoreductase [Roseburia sp. 499]|uniref:NAD(P)/FAD-dependent oxidoreductase n=1 Tax=Roseburia sp. 499 TaxID=1261634 RepID=UPI0009531737|nr:NAD(P)/FAD-dependent oxidoreductase [Roseburia sp. 499]WVK71296.1 NAD(P)/FAD-dependent oxidoreductase [Roseburia sp. 499]
MSKVIVIGGGAAGMFAAIQAAEQGHSVVLLEKNEKLGKKIYITGKGRCNITNACDTEELFQNVMRNSKFLYSAFYTCSNYQVMDFFESNGLPIKTERGERVFPQSDHSSDVIATLQRVLKKQGVTVQLHSEVKKLKIEDGQIKGVLLKNGSFLEAERVIVATGGCSYITTGSTGDGYRFAREVGHTVTELYPALVPFETEESWIKELQGLSLKNVSVKIEKNGKVLYDAFGEMLFTHYGVSGPLLLSASSMVNDYADKMPLQMSIDLKPALEEEQLDKRILRDFEENQNRQFKNAVQKLFPAKMIPVIIRLSGISPEKKVNEITKEERQQFVKLIKAFPLTLSRFRDFNEAIITRGGVSVKEVNPSTMESKIVKGLYFAGEVLDLDALTGGFNLQIAWSTGYLAGNSIE